MPRGESAHVFEHARLRRSGIHASAARILGRSFSVRGCACRDGNCSSNCAGSCSCSRVGYFSRDSCCCDDSRISGPARASSGCFLGSGSNADRCTTAADRAASCGASCSASRTAANSASRSANCAASRAAGSGVAACRASRAGSASRACCSNSSGNATGATSASAAQQARANIHFLRHAGKSAALRFGDLAAGCGTRGASAAPAACPRPRGKCSFNIHFRCRRSESRRRSATQPIRGNSRRAASCNSSSAAADVDRAARRPARNRGRAASRCVTGTGQFHRPADQRSRSGRPSKKFACNFWKLQRRHGSGWQPSSSG